MIFVLAVVIPAVAPSATLSSVLASAAVSVSISPVPLLSLPMNTPVPTVCILPNVTALASILAIGRVPDVISVALSEVKFAPLVAGSVVGNLPFGITPDPRLSALSDVSNAPDP